MLRDIPEERRFHLRRDVSLKLRLIKMLILIHHMAVQSNSKLAYSPTDHTAEVCC
jgi:hypothetical protein